MKKITIFSLLVISVIVSGCSIKLPNNQPTTPSNPINSDVEIQLREEINKLTSEVDILRKEQIKSQTLDQSAAIQSNFKTYSNVELGIAFDYPKEWPEPVLIKNKSSDGSYFDRDNQWEIELGELHKNSIEGADKYFASIRGYYSQDREEVMSQLNDPKNKGSLWLIDQFKNKQAEYVVYGEAGIVGVKDIMFFGENGKTIRIQSINDSFDADIYSVALSLRAIK